MRPPRWSHSLIFTNGLVGILLGVCGWAQAAAGALVINELLPDPQGTDSGHEFVELLNTGPVAFPLQGVSLEFANGAVAVSWLTRWSAGPGETLAAGARYLVVDRNWVGPVSGDATVYLGLQNGPDAIRLVAGATVLDQVGYGHLTDSVMFEGTPVPIVTGRSLARRPDGTDTNDNDHDFVSAVPTPGMPNFLPYNVELDDLIFDPPHLPRSGDLLVVNLRLRNAGTEDLDGGSCAVVWPGGEAWAWWDFTPPDGVRDLVFRLRPWSRGPVALRWEYVDPTRGNALSVDLGAVQIGAAGLRLSEVMSAPTQHQGEWIELTWAGPGNVDLAGYALGDEDGVKGYLDSWVLFPKEIIVVAEDAEALAFWHATNLAEGQADCRDADTPLSIVAISRWPSLNNSPPDGRGFSDRVYLTDPEGLVVDAVAWGGVAGIDAGRGVSLERLAAEPVNPGATNWALCVAQIGSTPGCANSVGVREVPGHAGAGLVVVPGTVDREGGAPAVHIQFVLREEEYAWSLKLFNLWGDTVRDFGGDARGPGQRDLVWGGHDDRGRLAEPGILIAWLETRSAAGRPLRREKARLVVR